jgi:hypothetical protein
VLEIQRSLPNLRKEVNVNLAEKKAAYFYPIREDWVNERAQFVDQEMVRDGNLITSRNSIDLPAFCREIIKGLRGELRERSRKPSSASFPGIAPGQGNEIKHRSGTRERRRK